ncbi:hypothetical protein [Occultella gossypii]|uniref:Uncharacterized protein n=1 Tax=Occultella gossypii TaxID=2800820 RepID=A0ABS7S6L3_9MICO|nr:hypothetical protein [Occultella gossypii]MBZ2195937.1 hypothetical protein [Occultella gossypii]
MTAFQDPTVASPSVPVLRLDTHELAALLGNTPTPAARISRAVYGLDPETGSDGSPDLDQGRESLVGRGLLGPSGAIGDAKRVSHVLTHSRAWIRVIGASGDAAHVVMGVGRAVLSSPIPNGHEFAPIVASVAVAEAVADLVGAVVQRSGRPAKVHVVRLGAGRTDDVIDVPVDFLERDVVVDVVRSLGLPLSDVR